jgi:signal transduction histidine kinase
MPSEGREQRDRGRWRWGGDDQPLFMHSLRLEDQLFDFVFVRFIVVAALIGGSYFAREVVGIAQLDVAALCLLALLLGLCNTITFALVRPYRGHHDQAEPRRWFLAWVLNFSIASDFLCLTIALWLLGGAQSPFQAFFIFHVIIASVLLAPQVAFVHTAIGYLLLAGLVVGTWRGWIPARYPEGAVPSGLPITGRFVVTVLAVQGMLFATTAILVTHLMRFLREGQRQALHANRELERLSRQRRDFLHIALHNLRSPVAAVGMHLNNLRAGYGGPLSERQEEWISRSQQRVTELTSFLNDLEYLAALNSGELQREVQVVNVPALLQELVAQNQDLAQARRHRLTLEIDPGLPNVGGFARLLREAVVNFITNAIKYTPEGGIIKVRAVRVEDVVRIEVADNGVGIPQEDQPRLFQEFVRVHKNKPGMTDIPGSGLGLYIVRQIVEAHGGRVDLKSAPGQGSIFAMELPISAPEAMP